MKTLLVIVGLVWLSGCKALCINECNDTSFHCSDGDKECYGAVQKCFDSCKNSPLIIFHDSKSEVK